MPRLSERNEGARHPLIRAQPTPLAYRINDAAAAIGIGRTKIYELIADGKLRAVKRDGVTFVRAADLDAYLAGAEEVTNAAQASMR